MSKTLIGTNIHKRDSKGKAREWRIEVIDLGNSAEMKTIAGLADGKKVESSVVITEGKNIGKANETTPLEQATKEAESKYKLKLRKEYVKDLKDAKQGVSGSGMQKPMLAQKYSREKKKGYKTLEQMKIGGQTVAFQPKIDGNRCLIVIDKALKATMWTRTGKQMPVQITHILDEVVNSLKEFNGFEGLKKDLILDGELFSDEVTFNELNGALKRVKSKDAEKMLRAKEVIKSVKYHLYDIMTSSNYRQRYSFLKDLFSDSVRPIENIEVELTQENIDKYLKKFLKEGHEGLMIRQLDMPYEHKRSWQLIKVKTFIDDEYELVDIIEDKRGGFVGSFVMKAPKGLTNREGKTIETFDAGVSGLTQEQGAEMLANKEDYIGKWATIECFELSEYGIPRFGKLKAFRDKEDIMR